MVFPKLMHRKDLYSWNLRGTRRVFQRVCVCTSRNRCVCIEDRLGSSPLVLAMPLSYEKQISSMYKEWAALPRNAHRQMQILSDRIQATKRKLEKKQQRQENQRLQRISVVPTPLVTFAARRWKRNVLVPSTVGSGPKG